MDAPLGELGGKLSILPRRLGFWRLGGSVSLPCARTLRAGNTSCGHQVGHLELWCAGGRTSLKICHQGK